MHCYCKLTNLKKKNKLTYFEIKISVTGSLEEVQQYTGIKTISKERLYDLTDSSFLGLPLADNAELAALLVQL